MDEFRTDVENEWTWSREGGSGEMQKMEMSAIATIMVDIRRPFDGDEGRSGRGRNFIVGDGSERWVGAGGRLGKIGRKAGKGFGDDPVVSARRVDVSLMGIEMDYGRKS